MAEHDGAGQRLGQEVLGKAKLNRAGRVEPGALRVRLLKERSPPFPGFYPY